MHNSVLPGFPQRRKNHSKHMFFLFYDLCAVHKAVKYCPKKGDFLCQSKNLLLPTKTPWVFTSMPSSPPQIWYSHRMYAIYANSCGQYGTTWACPPGVGTLEECKSRILKYQHLFVFTTVHELEDSYDFEGMMEGKERHNALCPNIAESFRNEYPDLLILSAEGCNRCKTCTYPDAPCRFPDTLYPSIESYCVEVNRLASTAGIHYINGENTVTYFGCIMY